MPQHGGGCATLLVAVLNKSTSDALLLVSPGNIPLFPLFHFGKSWLATVFGSSPLFKRLIRVEEPALPYPTFNAQLTKAPY
jgi:hypothetical protein